MKQVGQIIVCPRCILTFIHVKTDLSQSFCIQVEVFAEIGEVLAGKKTLPRVPDCGKKFIVFKSLGKHFNSFRVVQTCLEVGQS